jgi:hypothetical protein
MNEIYHVIKGYKLPELPEEYNGEDSASVMLFLQHDTSITRADSVSIADAREYCQREDTHGDCWFVGYFEN